jgi:hypothetical protein
VLRPSAKKARPEAKRCEGSRDGQSDAGRRRTGPRVARLGAGVEAGYATRLSRLLGPGAGGTAGGVNGGYYLNRATAHDDGVVDLLWGGAGMDWFFPRAAGQCLLVNRRKGEVVTGVQ